MLTFFININVKVQVLTIIISQYNFKEVLKPSSLIKMGLKCIKVVLRFFFVLRLVYDLRYYLYILHQFKQILFG